MLRRQIKTQLSHGRLWDGRLAGCLTLIQFRDLNGAESSRLNLTMRTTWALPPGRQLTHWTGASLAPTFSITSKLTAPALEC
jgi:hypothetical protein